MIEIVTAPAVEPITSAEAKLHLRETATGQDTRVAVAIEGARNAVEAWTGRALITRTIDLKLPAFPREILLPYAPLASATQVTHVKYVDTDGDEQTLTLDTHYRVLAPSGPQCSHGRIILQYNEIWPDTRSQPDAVRVRYVAGYATSATGSIPGALKEAMYLLIGDSFENREAQVVGATIADNRAVQNLIWPFRLEMPQQPWC